MRPIPFFSRSKRRNNTPATAFNKVNISYARHESHCFKGGNSGFAVARQPPQSRQQLQLRPIDIPEDIGRCILELAAWDDKKTAYTLLFVSRKVYEWIKPVLLRVFSPRITEPQTLEWVLLSYSPYDLAHHVRACYISIREHNHTFQFLEACQNVQHLSCITEGSDYILPALGPSINHLRPTSLILPVESVFSTVDFTLPFFSNLTHLYVTDLPYVWPKWRTLHLLPCLTHLAFDRYSYSTTTFASLRYILQRCKQLENLLIVVGREFFGTSGFDKELLKDIRLVFVCVTSLANEWEDFVNDGRDNFWVYADRIVNIRRKSQLLAATKVAS